MKGHKYILTLIIIILVLILGGLCGYYLIDAKNRSLELTEKKSQEATVVKEDENEEETKTQRLICIGDSLTMSNNSYPDRLKELTGLDTITYGGKSLTSKDITARLAAYTLYVEPFTIPEDTSAVKIQLVNNNGGSSNLLQKDGSSINPCQIDGIEGNINYDSSQQRYTFTRSGAGDSKVIENRTKITITKQDINEDDIVIMLMGTYDEDSPYFTDNLITFYESIIDQYNLKNYIIVSLTTNNVYNDFDTTNKELKEKFGDHFLDFRSYLLTDGAKDAGITLSSQDEEDISNNVVPECFRSGDVNGNAAFGILLANQLEAKMKTLKYIE